MGFGLFLKSIFSRCNFAGNLSPYLVGKDSKQGTRTLGMIRRGIYHHTATAPNLTANEIAQITHSRLGYGMAYHFCVWQDGTYAITRALEDISAHTGGNNSDAISICFVGNYETDEITGRQLAATRKILKYLRKNTNIQHMTTHNRLRVTKCPGANFPDEFLINML